MNFMPQDQGPVSVYATEKGQGNIKLSSHRRFVILVNMQVPLLLILLFIYYEEFYRKTG